MVCYFIFMWRSTKIRSALGAAEGVTGQLCTPWTPASHRSLGEVGEHLASLCALCASRVRSLCAAACVCSIGCSEPPTSWCAFWLHMSTVGVRPWDRGGPGRGTQDCKTHSPTSRGFNLVETRYSPEQLNAAGTHTCWKGCYRSLAAEPSLDDAPCQRGLEGKMVESFPW